MDRTLTEVIKSESREEIIDIITGVIVAGITIHADEKSSMTHLPHGTTWTG